MPVLCDFIKIRLMRKIHKTQTRVASFILSSSARKVRRRLLPSPSIRGGCTTLRHFLA